MPLLATRNASVPRFEQRTRLVAKSAGLQMANQKHNFLALPRVVNSITYRSRVAPATLGTLISVMSLEFAAMKQAPRHLSAIGAEEMSCSQLLRARAEPFISIIDRSISMFPCALMAAYYALALYSARSFGLH